MLLLVLVEHKEVEAKNQINNEQGRQAAVCMYLKLLGLKVSVCVGAF